VRNSVGPTVAQSVIAGLVSFDIIRGRRHFALGSASIASELAGKMIAIGWVYFEALSIGS
jgi:hypothetical protein